MTAYYSLRRTNILCYCGHILLFRQDGWNEFISTEFSKFKTFAYGEILTMEVKNVSDFKERIEKMYPEYQL